MSAGAAAIARAVQRPTEARPAAPPISQPPPVMSGGTAAAAEIAAESRPPAQQPLPEESAQPVSAPASPAAADVVTPPRPRRPFPYLPVIGGLVLVFGLTGIGWYLATRKATPGAPPPPAAKSDYADEVAAGEFRKNDAGRFEAKIPRGWSIREEDKILTAESADKSVVVDFLRDERLDSNSVQSVVRLPDAQVQKLDARKHGALTLTSFVSSAAGRARYAVLHEPAGDTPGLALLETSSEIFLKLPRAVVDSLTREGFRLRPLAPSKPAATPAPPLPEPTQVAQVATPTPASAPTDTATPQPTATPPPPTPTATPTATPAVTAPPTATAAAAPESGFSIASDRIRLRLSLPAGWSGESLADGQVLALKSPSGVDIKMTREPKPATAKAVFDAMAAEGWDVIARNENRRAGVLASDLAEMKKGNERVILILLGYPDKSTVYIYASNKDKFLTPQREDLSRLIQTLAAQEPAPATP
ncbi:MAG: hypothetical protein N2111_00680 [Candidatus Sumerlaeaceae bacterium]|nr:hypothetical protein [Candidatus Sumerlaeaceae bacterium]